MLIQCASRCKIASLVANPFCKIKATALVRTFSVGAYVRREAASFELQAEYDSSSASCGEEPAYQFLHSSLVPSSKFQASLPRLPIPALAVTCQRYLASQAPLLETNELDATRRRVEQFRDGAGKQLDGLLRSQDKANKWTSYINGMWTDMYLSDRRPLVFTHNPGMIFAHDPRPEFADPAARAANIVVSSLRFHRTFANGRLTPDVFHMAPKKTDNATYWKRVAWMPERLAAPLSYLFGVFPLDMSQHPHLMQSTRIPLPDKDELRRFPEARHIVVLRDGRTVVDK